MELHHPGHDRDRAGTLTRRTLRSVRRSQRGAAAVELVLVAAFILIPFAMLMLGLPILVEYRSMGDAAAREAVRACANAYNPSTGQQRAHDIAHQILDERGIAAEGASVSVDCLRAWEPGGVVTATVSFDVPVLEVVGIGDFGSVTIERTYREQIEPYRSAP